MSRYDPVPKVTPVDELILITKDAISALKMELSKLEALRQPYRGRFEPIVNPRTGKVYGEKRKSKPRKRAPETV